MFHKETKRILYSMLCVLFCISCTKKPSPQDTVKAFLEACKENKIDKINAFFSDETLSLFNELNKICTKTKKGKWQKYFAERFSTAEWEVESEKIVDNEAYVSLKCIGGAVENLKGLKIVLKLFSIFFSLRLIMALILAINSLNENGFAKKSSAPDSNPITLLNSFD